MRADRLLVLLLRIYLDAAGWFHHEEEVPYLQVIQEAVWNGRRLHLEYQRGNLDIVERLIDPYGLVAKASSRYVVAACDGEMRVYRVSRIQTQELRDSMADFAARIATFYKR